MGVQRFMKGPDSMADQGERRGLSRKVLTIIIAVFVVAVLVTIITSVAMRGPGVTMDQNPDTTVEPTAPSAPN